MVSISESSRKFLQENLPEALNEESVNGILDLLYDLIVYKGFDEEYAYNDFGDAAQAVYDDIYLNAVEEA